jgi:hypothetical protein
VVDVQVVALAPVVGPQGCVLIMTMPAAQETLRVESVCVVFCVIPVTELWVQSGMMLIDCLRWRFTSFKGAML